MVLKFQDIMLLNAVWQFFMYAIELNLVQAPPASAKRKQKFNLLAGS